MQVILINALLCPCAYLAINLPKVCHDGHFTLSAATEIQLEEYFGQSPVSHCLGLYLKFQNVPVISSE
jgi:hypothetical protein